MRVLLWAFSPELFLKSDDALAREAPSARLVDIWHPTPVPAPASTPSKRATGPSPIARQLAVQRHLRHKAGRKAPAANRAPLRKKRTAKRRPGASVNRPAKPLASAKSKKRSAPRRHVWLAAKH